jgi:hypothetical protein
MLAAHAELVDELEACLREAYLGEAPWPHRVRHSVAAALGFFSARPPAARFMLIELFAIGPPARERFHEGYNRFVALFEEGLDAETRAGAGPVQAAKLAVGAVAARTYEEVLVGRAAELPRLTDELTYELVVPFLGEDAAREAASS